MKQDNKTPDISLEQKLNSIQKPLSTSAKQVDEELSRQVFALCLADVLPSPQLDKTKKFDLP